MTRERRYKLWLAYVTAYNPERHRSLMLEYGGAEAVYEAAARGELPRNPRDRSGGTDRICAKATEEYIDERLGYLQKRGIDAVLPEDENYPELLREIYFPPAMLFVKGRLPAKIELPVAVIGSRKHTDYGREVAERLGGELARCGACVVSGMAYGIDAVAARAALKEGAAFPTVAVLGSGVDVAYPEENRGLYDEICERGAVISEFPPGTGPMRYNFPRRNRIISGMSKGVVVVEAARRSGTGITVDFALEQGRDVFAVPGRITDIYSEGTNRMIREGMAKAVFCTEDILEEYGVDMGARERAAKVEEGALNLEERAIFELLKAGEKSVDELCGLTGMDMGKLNSSLTGMEISGIIKQSPGRMYGL